MPYLNYLFCDDCGPPANLDVDYIGTVEAYLADGRKIGKIDDRNIIWDYLIYTCGLCRKQSRYTYLDVESRVRQYLYTAAERHRQFLEEMVAAQSTEEARQSGEFFVEQSKIAAKRIKEMYGR